LIFGDHGRIVLNESEPYKLLYATTMYPNCTGANDTIIAGNGSDIVFGGGWW